VSTMAAVSALLVLLASASASGQAGPSSTALPVLTTAQQVRVLTPDEANRGYPVRLRAVVTYSDIPNHDFFIQDATAGIYVNDSAQFAPGQLLEIQGVTEDVDFAPQIAKPHYRVLGQAPFPKPKSANFDALASTREDSQFVEFEGIVQSADTSTGHLVLDVVGGGGHVNTVVLDSRGLVPDRLVDARVRFRGVCATIFNDKRRLTGIQVDLAAADQLTVIEPAAPAPFSLPVRSLDDLTAFTPQDTTEHRIHVQGTVTIQRRKGFFIQDGTQALFIPGARQERLSPGERVDVVGFADIGEYTPVVRQAIVRRLGSAPLPEPITLTAAQAFTGSFDAVRIRVEGTVHDERHGESDQEIVLQQGDVLFEARIDRGKAPHGWIGLEPGTRVRLTGVCSVSVDRDRIPTGFVVLLDSPADLAILSRPSWWTLSRTLSGAGLLLVTMLAVLVWVVVLRRRVEEQTELIRRKLESEAALEKRLQYVMRSTNDTVWDWDLQAQTVWRSDGLETMLEYRPESVGTGIDWWYERIHPEDRDRIKQEVATLIKGAQQQWSGEYRFLRGTGEYAYILDRGYVIRDAAGNAVRAIGAMMDVSGIRSAQEELRKSEEKYRSLVTNIPDAIWTANAEGQFAYVSPKFEQFSGYTLEQIKERGVALFLESVHPDDKLAATAAFLSIFAQGYGEVECRVQRKDGKWMWVHNRAVAVYERDGVKYADGLVTDITRRKLVEEALRQNEESFRLLFSDNPLPMWVYDTRTLRFLEVNATAVDRYGYSRAEFLGMRITEIRPKEDLAKLERVLEGVRPARQESGPWRHCLKGGRLIDVQTTSHSMKWNGADAALVVAQDITERKKAQEALQHSEQRHRLLFERNLAGVLGAEADGRIADCNEACAQILGYNTRQELIGVQVRDLIADPEAARTATALLAGQGALTGFEVLLKGKNGKEVWVIANVTLVVNETSTHYEGTFIDLTERKRAEAANVRLATAVEQSADSIVVSDIAGNIQYVNPAFSRMTGYSAEEAVGRNSSLLKSDSQPPAFYRDLWDTILSGNVWHGELTNRRKDGTLYTEQMNITPVRDSAGAITNFIAIKQDVTERNLAAEARAFLASIVESSDDAIIGRTTDGAIVSWNRGAEALYGYHADEVIGRPFSMVVAPERLDVVREVSKSLARGEKVSPFDGVALRKDGARVPISVCTSPIKGASGQTTGVAVVARDVTARRQAQQAGALLASIVESSDDAIIGKTLDGTIVSWNHGAESLYGYRADEITGKSIALLSPPDRTDELLVMLDRMRRGENISHFDTARMRKDGTLVDVSISISPLKNAAGEVTGASTIARDMTGRKRAEESLRRRTEELERSNAELEQFAYVASHDLQEPLRMVANFTQLLADRYQGRLDQDADEFIGFAVEGATRMQALINGLLCFARVKSRAGELEPTDAEAAFGRSLAGLRAAISDAHAQVTNDPLPTVVVDDLQLEQVFQNLVGNALKFRGSKPCRVHVSAERNGREWIFAVKDNGIGIDPRYHERIFVIFQRLHTRQAYPGTGIGLAICKRIVERHGGRIWVESGEGNGATFYFTIPDRNPDPPAPTPLYASDNGQSPIESHSVRAGVQ
jgi:PAS domain S-box-containing protein